MSWYADIFNFRNNRGGQPAYSFTTHSQSTRSGENISPEKALRNPTVFACVNAIARTVAQSQIAVVRRDDRGYAPILNHRITRLLERPSPILSQYELIHSIITDLMVYGNSYVLRKGQELIPLDPQYVTIEKNAAGRPIYNYEGDAFTFTQDEVIHLRDFAVHEIDGLSRVLQCADLVAIDNALDRITADVLRHGNAVSGVLSSPNNISPDEAKAISEAWQNKFSGKGESRGGVLIASGGMQYTPMEFLNLNDADAIALKKQVMSRIASVFGVPAQYLEISDNSKYNNVSQKKTSFYSDTLAPLLVNIEQKLSNRLLSDNSLAIRFDRKELIVGDLVSQAGVSVNLVSSGIATPNEARSFLGWSQLDDPAADQLAVSQQPTTPNPSDEDTGEEFDN